MPIGHYVFQGSGTRYLYAFAYEEITVTSGHVGFTPALLEVAEFAAVRFSIGGFRALWFPGCTSVLTNSYGVIFWDNTYDTFNRLEMRYFLATLNSGASTGVLQVHYYQPPTP